MSNVQTKMYLETPTRTISDSANTKGKSDIGTPASANDKQTAKKNFKQFVDEIGETVTNMEQLAKEVMPIDTITEGLHDNSRCSNLCVNDIASVAGTLEGFELLGYQEGSNTVTIDGGLNQVAAANGAGHTAGTPMTAMMAQGSASETDANSGLPEQLAGMQKDEPMKAGTRIMTQQEILDKVETHLCSLESTNKDATTKSKAVGEIPTTFTESKDLNTSTLAKVLPLNENETETVNKQSNTQPTINIGPNGEVSVQQEGGLLGLSEAKASDEMRLGETFSKDNVINIVDKICVTNAEGKQSFDIKLKPDRLGSLNIKLAMQNGSIKVEINAQDASVKGLIAEQLPALQTLMEQKGIMVSSIEVGCETQSFLQQEGQMPNQNHGDNQSSYSWRMTTTGENAETSAGYEGASDWVGLYGDTSSVVFLA